MMPLIGEEMAAYKKNYCNVLSFVTNQKVQNQENKVFSHKSF